MTPPIVNPEIPYNDEIPGGFQAGEMCRIQGVTLPDSDRFNINFQTGPNNKPRDDTALHISVRLNQGYIARNSYKNGAWGDEQGKGSLPIGTGEHFEIIVLNTPQEYKVAVNGQHYCEFPHRIASEDVTHLLIDGDVRITLISWEGNVAQGDETASTATGLQSTGPSAPPQGEGYGPPPQGYGPPQGFPPQGQYGPPQGNYGPGYGPPQPPGAPEDSNMGNFLETAQEILAGAIKSGAAQQLLSGIFSSGSNPQQPPGYSPHNAQYGLYPQLPPQQPSPQRSPSHIPQFGGEGSIGGLGSVGSILGSLAGQLFKPSSPRDQGHY